MNYPNIKRMADVMYAANVIGSGFNEADYDEVLGNYTPTELSETDAWLATLGDEQLLVWADGEDEERGAMNETAPPSANEITEELFMALCE